MIHIWWTPSPQNHIIPNLAILSGHPSQQCFFSWNMASLMPNFFLLWWYYIHDCTLSWTLKLFTTYPLPFDINMIINILISNSRKERNNNNTKCSFLAYSVILYSFMVGTTKNVIEILWDMWLGVNMLDNQLSLSYSSFPNPCFMYIYHNMS